MPPEDQRRAAASLADAELFRGEPDDDVAAVYDRAADHYDSFRELWLRLAGAGAEEAMLADLRAVLRPGAKVLDAGCATGVLARRMRELQPDIELTLVDLSAAILARASDVPGEHVQGSEVALQKCCTVGTPVLPGCVAERTLLRPSAAPIIRRNRTGPAGWRGRGRVFRLLRWPEQPRTDERSSHEVESLDALRPAAGRWRRPAVQRGGRCRVPAAHGVHADDGRDDVDDDAAGRG